MMNKNILGSSIKVTFVVFFIKILGFVKQIVLASVYGTSYQMDAYFIASNVLYSLATIIFSSISVSFLSMYTEKVICRDKKEADSLVSDVIKFFLPIGVIFSIFVFVGSDAIAKMLAPSYEGEQINTLSNYIKIMAPIFSFVCYSFILNAVAESNKSFLPGKCINLFQNLFAIIIAILFTETYGIDYLVVSFLLAGAFQCVFLSVYSKKYFAFRRGISFSNIKSIKKLLYLSLPLLIGNAIYEINDIVDKRIASDLYTGGVSALSYGASLNELVSTVIISSVSTVLFSHFASWVATDNKFKIEQSLKKSSEILIVLLVPISIICIVCGKSIVSLLYGRGNFSMDAIEETGGVLIGYSTGFVFQALRSNFSKVFYAYKDTKIPMITGVVSVGINITLSVFLSKIFGVMGIAFATSVSMLVSTLILYFMLKKYLPKFRLSSGKELIKVIFSSAVMGIVVYNIHLVLESKVSLFFMLAVDGVIACVVYFILMFVMRSNAVSTLVDLIRNKNKISE